MRHILSALCLALPTLAVNAQQEPIASVPTEGVSLRGAMNVANGRAAIANNGEITAGTRTATIALTRGGSLSVCASTTVHIAKDAVMHAVGRPEDAGLMFSLNRGAFETSYTPGAYSDVILTPDLRLLVSGPGESRVKIRVNGQGDTCVDNPGEHAPYVIASSLADGGVYRVRSGQRVLFVGGSLQQVVDNEQEPCGCPPEMPVAMAGKSGGPSSSAADTAFPTAVSEGLQAPPTLAGSPPVVKPGEAHAQVSATLSSATPPGPPPPSAPAATPATEPAAKSVPVPAPVPALVAQKPRGVFGSIGHFFAKVFGAS